MAGTIVQKKTDAVDVSTPATGYATTFVNTGGVLQIKDDTGAVSTTAVIAGATAPGGVASFDAGGAIVDSGVDIAVVARGPGLSSAGNLVVFASTDGITLADGGPPLAGGGTVTSVDMTVPPILSVAGAPITSAGTLALTLVAQVANSFLAGPTTGPDVSPIFRAIGISDLPASVLLDSGSYADPAWLTSLAGSKITGNIAGDAASITGSITQSQVTGLTTDLAGKAPLASPTFTGTVTVPTPVNSTDAATKGYADSLVTGLWDDRGSYDASTNLFPATGGSGSSGAVLKGDIWTVSVAGTLGGTAVKVGDTVRALVDAPGQTAANWALMQGDLGYTPLNSAAATNHGVLLGTGSSAITALVFTDGQLLIGQTGADPQAKTLSGDATLSAAGALTLASTAVTPGSYGSASSVATYTVDAKGRITSGASVAIAIGAGAVSGLATVATSGSASDLGTGTLPNSRLSAVPNSVLANSAITIAGTSTSLGGSISQDTITGLSSTGLVKRTGANTLAIAVSGTDYLPSTGGSSVTTLGTVTAGTWNATAIGPTYGGTGLASYTLGDTLYSSATNTLSKLAGNTTSTKQFLTQTGTGSVSAAPAWGAIASGDLTTALTTPPAIGGTTPANGTFQYIGVTNGTAGTTSPMASWGASQIYASNTSTASMTLISTGGAGAAGYIAKGTQEADLILQCSGAASGQQAFYYRVKNGVFSVINLSDNLSSINNYVTAWRYDGRFSVENTAFPAFDALVKIGAGTATAGTAPLKFTAGTNNTTAEAGAVEYNGTNLFFTRTGTARETIFTGVSGASAPSTTATPTFTSYYGNSATVAMAAPNSWTSVNINGTTYKIPLYT